MTTTAMSEEPRTADAGAAGRAWCVRHARSLAEVESLLAEGPLSEWESLAASDPTATFFQSTAWCVEWYRSYREEFRPLVIYVSQDSRLVGLIPLAVEGSTGRLTFAGDNMSDYRDVIAAEGHRSAVVAELLKTYAAEGRAGSLRLGPTQPESETVPLALSQCAVAGVRAIRRSHPCWRWRCADAAEAGRAVKRKFVHRHLNHYRRQGGLALERVGAGEGWERVRSEFFEHHSLRQIQAGRPVSFNDARKRAFHDALIERHPDAIHFSVLRRGGEFLAAHYGFLWRGVLYWGAPTFDVREERHSPGQLLLALLMQEAPAQGLRAIDFTLGTEEYKSRFGNECVALPSADLYAAALAYRIRTARDGAVAAAKAVARRAGGERGWAGVVRLGERAAGLAGKVREKGLRASLTRAAARGQRAVWERHRGLVFVAGPEDVSEVVPVLGEGEVCAFHEDEVRDLARWDGDAAESRGELARTLAKLPEARRSGHTLHTVTIGGRLAGWGWSYWPESRAFLTETETFLEFEPRSVSLYDFHVVPEFRGRRLYQALLAHILRLRFAGGAERAYINCLESNVASRKAIERAGFRLLAVDEFSRWFKWKRSRRLDA